jgi:hypothetical protein
MPTARRASRRHAFTPPIRQTAPRRAPVYAAATMMMPRIYLSHDDADESLSRLRRHIIVRAAVERTLYAMRPSRPCLMMMMSRDAEFTPRRYDCRRRIRRLLMSAMPPEMPRRR